MKTLLSLQKNTLKLIGVLIFAILFVSFSNEVHAQKTSLSLIVGTDISGNGLGSSYCPALGLTVNKFTVSVGPNIQKRRHNISGVQANMRYSLAKNNSGLLELYVAGNVAYHDGAFLSKSCVDVENLSNQVEGFRFDDIKYKVVQGFVGIGLKVNATQNISACLSSSVGVYDTLDKNYDTEMYRQSSAFVLQLRCALSYNFGSTH